MTQQQAITEAAPSIIDEDIIIDIEHGEESEEATVQELDIEGWRYEE